MRIKMLIVDDEAVIREGLRYTINWAECGVEVVGEASDGREALLLVEKYDVDLVLSDIRMDGMGGLELAEQLQLHHPHVKVVMISGYEDFGYARQAIRLGVNDYLLKPVDIEELTTVVSGIVTGIREKVRQKAEREILSWLSGVARHGSAYGQEPPTSLAGVQYRILATQIADFRERFAGMDAESYEDLQQAWVDGLQRRLKQRLSQAISVFDHENLLITLMVADEPLDSSLWDSLMGQSIEALAPAEAGLIFGGASAIYSHLEDTAQRCAEAGKLLELQVLGKCQVITLRDYTEVMTERKLAGLDVASIMKKLVSALFKQDRQEVQTIVAEMFRFFRDSGYLLPEIWKIYEEAFALLRQRLRQSGMTGLDYGHPGQPDPNIYNSYAGLEAVVMEDMQALQQLIDKTGMDKSYWVVEKAKKFIVDHYRTDLKASEVAAWLKITPSYFSYIFKQSTGRGFTEYMNEMRIEQAKDLLATTHDKVFEIADKVGYKEYKYFVSVFKLHTGMTPKEYRGLRVGKDTAPEGTEMQERHYHQKTNE
ncbi:response regulator transcription factor [Paenibacillus senegalimassiliensis]|uniref:response regulator transcription factor n=1 Tax=Paenibacillus senegalimassiliensis TaxID=1737426 RepID=UPI00073EDD9F|nr:response regulator [Paenibacillus senegalimassiliensis]